MPSIAYVIAFVLAITATLIVVLWGIAKLMAHFNVTLPETNYPTDDAQPANETAESIAQIVVTDLDRARFKVDSVILGTGMLGVLNLIRALRYEKFDNAAFLFILFGMLIYGLSMKSRFAAVISLLLVVLDAGLAAYSQRYWGAVALMGLAGIIWQGVANLFLFHKLKSKTQTTTQN